MTSDVFQLLGKISVDTTEFTNRINAALTAVNNLATAINGLDGRTVNVNVNTNTNNPTNTPTNTQTAAQNTNPTQQNDDDNGGATTVVMPGSKGWTVGKGIATNLATDALRRLGQKAEELMEIGLERNIQEDVMTAKFAALTNSSYEDATLLMDELNQFALDTPLDAPDVWSAAMRMLNYGIPPENLIEEMGMLGNIAMGDSTAMGSIAKAYTETLGKNMLYAQEGYQFVNAGVPIYQLLEEYYASDAYTGGNKGLSAADIKGRLNAQGDNGVTVSAEDVKAALGIAVSPGGRYYNMMNGMMDTPYGQLQRIGENTEVISAGTMKPLLELAEKFNVFTSILALQDKILSVSDWSDPIGGIFGEYVRDKLANLGGATWSAAEPSKGTEQSTFEPTPYAIPFLDKVYDPEFQEFVKNYVNSTMAGTLLNKLFQESGLEGFESAPGVNSFPTDGEPLWTKLWPMLNNGTDDTDSIVEQKVRELLRESQNTEDIPPDYESRLDKRDSEFGGSFADKLFFDDGNYLPATSGLSSLLVELQNMPQQVTAAVQDGISGMTITANVSTGNVTLQDGTLVGALAPRINFILGAMGARSSRG